VKKTILRKKRLVFLDSKGERKNNSACFREIEKFIPQGSRGFFFYFQSLKTI
jgi:hypothetical protein